MKLIWLGAIGIIIAIAQIGDKRLFDDPCVLVCAPNGYACKWCPIEGSDNCGKAPGVIEGEQQDTFCRPHRFGKRGA
jgi:hypothetical protein